jgi:hypothetical protein
MFRLEYLNAYKVALEHTRAEANEELIETLHDYEMDESAHFDQMQQRWENERKDPDNVFFKATDRKQEIKEQIRELQRSLERRQPKRKARRR